MNPTSRHDRGVATLAVVAGIMLVISTALLYLGRYVLVEQRSASVNVFRTQAQEAAEAGLTWATTLLNAPQTLNSACVPSNAGGLQTFRRTYAQPGGLGTALLPPSRSFPGCKLSPTGLNCSCPTPGTGLVVSSASGSEPAFTVAITPVSDSAGVVQTDAVRITATGCSAYSGSCGPGTAAGSGGPDAVSTASVIVKLDPVLRSRPGAVLTCAGDCRLQGAQQALNRDTNTNGVVVNAGGVIQGCDTRCFPLQGTPPPNGIKAGDAFLSGLFTQDPSCSASALFKRYFGLSVAEYGSQAFVHSLPSCSDAATCASSLQAALTNGSRAFLLQGDFRLDNRLGGTIGSATDPVILVSQGNLRLEGNVTVHGLVFGNQAGAQSTVLDNATVKGAVIQCGNATLTTPGVLDYHPQTMQTLLKSVLVARRVPGSWTDLCAVSSNSTVTCR